MAREWGLSMDGWVHGREMNEPTHLHWAELTRWRMDDPSTPTVGLATTDDSDGRGKVMLVYVLLQGTHMNRGGPTVWGPEAVTPGWMVKMPKQDMGQMTYAFLFV